MSENIVFSFSYNKMKRIIKNLVSKGVDLNFLVKEFSFTGELVENNHFYSFL